MSQSPTDERPDRTPAGEPAEPTPALRGNAPAWLTIAVLSLLILSAGIFVEALVTSRSADETGPGGGSRVEFTPAPLDPWTSIQREIQDVRAMHRETMALRTEDDPARFQREVERTMERIGEVLARADALLEEVRDPETGQLPAGYEWYDHQLQPLILRLHDLERASHFGVETVSTTDER